MTNTLPLIVRWPAQMRAETAAAYLDEVSPAAFLRSVKAGLYPQPRHIVGKGPRWLIEDLDAARVKLHGAGSRPRGLKDRVG